MKLTPTTLPGAWIVDVERIEDDRGFSERTWCRREFEAAGISADWAQSLRSFNRTKGTLRGMHFQRPPASQAKLVRCTRGAVYDVLLDLRPDSESFLKWVSVDLSADSGRGVFIPKGVAHGYLTLEDGSEVFYLMSDYYVPGLDAGVRWNDPRFGIRWPEGDKTISARDRGFPDFVPGP
jgi:dTDP-4-dehydrorhamnose 3,5-epimerase